MQKIHLKLKELLNTQCAHIYIRGDFDIHNNRNGFAKRFHMCDMCANCQINDVCAGARIPEKMKKQKMN